MSVGARYRFDRQTFVYLIGAKLSNGVSARYDNWSAADPCPRRRHPADRARHELFVLAIGSCKVNGRREAPVFVGGGLTMGRQSLLPRVPRLRTRRRSPPRTAQAPVPVHRAPIATRRSSRARGRKSRSSSTRRSTPRIPCRSPQAFEKKYGVKVDLWRSSSEKVLQRAMTEAQRRALHGGRVRAQRPGARGDVSRGAARGVLQPAFQATCRRRRSPSTAHYVADRFNFFTIAYNTNLVKPNEVPNSYEDLVHPRWAGTHRHRGERHRLVRLDRQVHGRGEGPRVLPQARADMKPQMRTGHTLMAELVASGEIPLAATIYNHNAERLVVKGAPIKWKALTPTFGRPNGVARGEARRAPARGAALRRLHALARRAST